MMNATQVYKKVGADFYALGDVIASLQSERDAAIAQRDAALDEASKMKTFFDTMKATFADVSVGTVAAKPIRKRRKAASKALDVDLDDMDKNDRALFEALHFAARDQPGEWLTDSQLHKLAEARGFTLKRPSVSNRMTHGADPLARRFKDVIEQRAKPVLAWRMV